MILTKTSRDIIADIARDAIDGKVEEIINECKNFDSEFTTTMIATIIVSSPTPQDAVFSIKQFYVTMASLIRIVKLKQESIFEPKEN